MSRKILVSASELNELIDSGDCITVDCRFDLTDPHKGRADWLAGHIPGAAYAHLDADLAAPINANSGRHPLPDPAAFAHYLASIAWRPGKFLVAYDEGSGAIASRLWWLMGYFGQKAALLDGGLQAWEQAGYSLRSDLETPQPVPVQPLIPDPAMRVDSAALNAMLGELSLVDARAAERFSGKIENMDSKAGHIPGALNRPLTENLAPDSRFRKPADLRRDFEALLAGRNPDSVVHSCGSGVTACHNLFAMELAGLGRTRLYPGSWSEWIRDPARPIETGS